VLEIREATEADREGIAFIDAFAFHGQLSADDVYPVEGTLCAMDANRVVGMSQAVSFGQWFGGAEVPCAGISGVAVLPEHRGRGVAAALMRDLLGVRRAAGDALTVLYPANSQLYHKLGYEFAGVRPYFTAPVADLPAARGDVELLSTADAADLEPLMSCFSRFVPAHNGPVQSHDPLWWAKRVLARKGDGLHQRTVVVPGPAGLDGYASYYTEERQEPQGVVVLCKHFVALSASALSTLLGYFRRFENSARLFGWPGPPSTSPVGLALSSNGFSINPSVSRWMGRVLDVPRALEARGYPRGVEAQLDIAVEDPLFADNSGSWELLVSGGRATVRRHGPRVQGDLAPGRPLPIGLFSALYSGFASPTDLVSLGALDPADPRVAMLTALFGGATPWMPDTF
jgi:predicted acetyltransferase